jgi:hypothetical protein
MRHTERQVAELLRSYGQAAPLRGAGPGASARAQPSKARQARAGPLRTAPLISKAYSSRDPVLRLAVFLALHCPAPGHRV